MLDEATLTRPNGLGAPAAPPVSFHVADVHVTYRTVEDRRRSARELFMRKRLRREDREIQAVRGVSFTVRQGDSVGIVGRNGSGKSTLLRAIAGLLPTTQGQVLARSRPVLLGVNAALNPSLSGRRNIYLGGIAMGMDRGTIDERFGEIVEFAGLEDFIDVPLRAYSSGMRSRLQFAIASARTPEILMVDEALAVGDAEFRRRSEDRIRELLDRAGTVVLVAHQLAFIQNNCSRVLWLDRGEVAADGPPDEVIAAYHQATGGPGTNGKGGERP